MAKIDKDALKVEGVDEVTTPVDGEKAALMDRIKELEARLQAPVVPVRNDGYAGQGDYVAGRAKRSDEVVTGDIVHKREFY